MGSASRKKSPTIQSGELKTRLGAAGQPGITGLGFGLYSSACAEFGSPSTAAYATSVSFLFVLLDNIEKDMPLRQHEVQSVKVKVGSEDGGHT